MTMDWPKDLSREKLMAYADGLLDEFEMTRIAEQVDASPELQQELDAYVDSRALLRNAFDEVLNEPVPPHLRALVLGNNAAAQDNIVSLRQPARSRATGLGFWRQAIAASVVLGLGIFVGSSLDRSGSNPSLLSAGMTTGKHPLASALDTARSGEVVQFGEQRFKALLSFATETGRVCREYTASDAADSVTGVACRSDAGWHVEILVSSGVPVSNSGNTYQPASGLEKAAIDEALVQIGARPGFDATDEGCLIENQWSLEVCLE